MTDLTITTVTLQEQFDSALRNRDFELAIRLKQKEANDLRTRLVQLQNHNLMIVEANKRLTLSLADHATLLRDHENQNLRAFAEAAKLK